MGGKGARTWCMRHAQDDSNEGYLEQVYARDIREWKVRLQPRPECITLITVVMHCCKVSEYVNRIRGQGR